MSTKICPFTNNNSREIVLKSFRKITPNDFNEISIGKN